MARECAFCPATADLTGEHLYSAWMEDLFPGRKRFTKRDEKGEIVGQWERASLDWKAHLVCGNCNNTWMSELENKHAKPAMETLILGSEKLEIKQSRARDMALFAFKTAVIFDQMQRNRLPFFSKIARYRFRKSFIIPFNINMWLAGYRPIGKGRVHTCYHDGTLKGNRVEICVCTYAIGHLVFQVVAVKQDRLMRLEPAPGFEHLAMKFWRRIPEGVCWPPLYGLQAGEDFDQFSMRWKTIRTID